MNCPACEHPDFEHDSDGCHRRTSIWGVSLLVCPCQLTHAHIRPPIIGIDPAGPFDPISIAWLAPDGSMHFGDKLPDPDLVAGTGRWIKHTPLSERYPSALVPSQPLRDLVERWIVNMELEKPAYRAHAASGARQVGKVTTTRKLILDEIEHLLLRVLFGNGGAGQSVIIDVYDPVGPDPISYGLSIREANPQMEPIAGKATLEWYYWRGGRRSDFVPNWLWEYLR